MNKTKSNLNTSHSEPTDLDNAFEKRMNQLVFRDKRPFCYLDFMEFEVDGFKYKMAHGTFRNKISKLMKKGKVRLFCYSPQGFYTLSETSSFPELGINSNLSKIITAQELTYFKNKPIYREIKNLPYGDCGLHNLHLKYLCSGLWQLLNNNKSYVPFSTSEDIRLVKLTANNLIITATVHRTDTVTVVVKCSQDQVILSTKGISRLDDTLSLLEAQIKIKIGQCKNRSNHYNLIIIPPRAEWIVTLWHFAIDSYSYYSGERFFCSWKVGKAVLISIYSKSWPDDKFRIRVERQENPDITFANALDEKRRQVNNSRSV